MRELFLGDPKLQNLLKQTGVSVRWDKPRKEDPCIRIVFPRPVDTASLESICSECQKPARIDFYSQADTRFVQALGILVRVNNIQVYRVEGCELYDLNPEEEDKARNDFALGIDSPEAERLEKAFDSECLANRNVKYKEQMDIAGQIIRGIEYCLVNKRLRMHSPSLQEIRAALK